MIKKNNAVVLMLMLILMMTPGGAVIAGADNGDTVKWQNETAQVTGAVPAGQAVKFLSLEDALKLAEENNAAIKKADIELEKSKIKLIQAKNAFKDINDAEDSPSGYMLSTFEAKGQVIIGQKAAEAGNQLAQKACDVAYEQIKLLIKKKYYAVLEAQDTVKVKESALKRAQKQLDTASASFKAGVVAKNDVLQAEMGLAKARADLAAARNAYMLAVIDLNREIGLDVNTQLQLTTKVDKKDILGEVDLQQYIDEALKNRLDIARDQAALDVAKISYDTAVSYTAPNTYVSRLAKLDMDSAARNLEETSKGVAYEVTQAYLNVQAAAEGLEFMEKAAEHARENLRLAETRYQVGVGTSMEVLNALVNSDEMETARVQALYRYNLAKMMFE